MDSESSNMKRKNENLEVTGISRSGRVRKKSSKLVDFESTDEVDNRHKRKSQSDKIDHLVGLKPKKIQKTIKTKLDEDGQNYPEVIHENGSKFTALDNSDTDNDLNQANADTEDYEVDEEENMGHYDANVDSDNNDGYEYGDVVEDDVADDDDDDDEDSDDIDEDDEEDDDNDDNVDDDDDDDDPDDLIDDDDDDYKSGQLVVDEKTPTQSLYMLEKSKKKLLIKDGKVIGTAKAERKDKGKTRFTAYMMWAKEIRKELSKQYPDMDFTTMARRLSELWGTVPNSERELWRRKAKREAAKKQKPRQEALLIPSRKFINKKGGLVQSSANHSPASKLITVSPSESQQQQILPLRKQPEAITSPGLYKVTGIAPIDVAAHLKLLGESLFIIGERLQEHEGQIAVSGSLSVLLDSLLCAVGPLLCLTQQVEEMKSNKQVLCKILQNVAYMMPGLG